MKGATNDVTTKKQRRWVIVVVAILGLTVALAANSWAASRAQEEAERTRAAVRSALQSIDFADALMPGFSLPDDDIRYHTTWKDPSGIRVTADAGVLWQGRCVVGTLDPTGQVTTEITSRAC